MIFNLSTTVVYYSPRILQICWGSNWIRVIRFLKKVLHIFVNKNNYLVQLRRGSSFPTRDENDWPIIYPDRTYNRGTGSNLFNETSLYDGSTFTNLNISDERDSKTEVKRFWTNGREKCNSNRVAVEHRSSLCRLLHDRTNERTKQRGNIRMRGWLDVLTGRATSIHHPVVVVVPVTTVTSLCMWTNINTFRPRPFKLRWLVYSSNPSSLFSSLSSSNYHVSVFRSFGIWRCKMTAPVISLFMRTSIRPFQILHSFQLLSMGL